jgi:hypothetical protein
MTAAPLPPPPARVSCPLLSWQRQDSTKTSLVESIAKPAHERREARLAGAVARRDTLQFERVVQHACDALDLFARRLHEMESANRRVELLVDLR